MLKQIFTYTYDTKLILELIENTKFGAITSNILAPLTLSVIMYNAIPISYVYIFLLFHSMIFISRVFLTNSFKNTIKSLSNKHLTTKFLKIYISLISLSAFSFSILFFYASSYGVGDLELFFIVCIIIALSAGSLATMGSVYIVFASFMLSNIIPIITVMSIHGGRVFYFSIIAFILYLILLLWS